MNTFKRKAAWWAGLLLLVVVVGACGGGGGTASSIPQPTDVVGPTVAPRAGIWNCYYLNDAPSVLEVADHTNCDWVSNELAGGPWWKNIADQLQVDRGTAIRNIVLHLYPQCSIATHPEVRAQMIADLDALRATGQLQGWHEIWIYWCDEAGTAGGQTEANVVEANEWLRTSYLPRAPELAEAKLAEIYNCDGPTPGFETFDRIGCDSYKRGCGVTATYDDYIKRLAPEQKLFMVPGGADDANPQSPVCLEKYAYLHLEVVAVVDFLWRDRTGIRGIRSNGWAPVFRAMGKRIVGAG